MYKQEYKDIDVGNSDEATGVDDDTGKTKAEKFLEQCNKITKKIHKEMQAIQRLFNTSYYEYSEETFQKLIRALEKEIEDVKSAYRNSGDAWDIFQ